MIAAPRPTNEEARLHALYSYHLLDTDPEEGYDDFARLAAFICGTPIAAITLLDAERQWFKSILGLPVRETPRDISFCAHTILQSDVMVVPDALADPRFADNPFVSIAPGVRFYAGVPLVTDQGEAIGSLCVIDTMPKSLTRGQEDALRTLARQVMGQMDLARHVAAQNRMIAEREQDALQMARLATIVESSADNIASIDLDGLITSWNRSLARTTGLLAEDVIGRHISLIATPDQVALIDKNNDRMRRGEVIAPTEIETQSQDGSRAYAILTVSPIWDRAGALVGSSSITRDITERRRAQENARKAERAQSTAEVAQDMAEQDYQTLFENAPEGIFRISPEGKFLQVNPALARIYGYRTPEILIQELNAVAAQLWADAGERRRFHSLMRKQGWVADFETRMYRRDREIIWISVSARYVQDAQGKLRYTEGFVQEITARKTQEAQQKQALLEAQEQADRDALTELFNHRAFQKKLEEEAARAQREGTSLAVVMLDLDDFKFFNDVYGHLVGDDVLRQVAKRLLAICRPYDTVARFGGDEFALLLPGNGQSTPAEIETRLCANLGDISFRPEGQITDIPITVSVGAALVSPLSTDCHDALQRADERLIRSKTGGEADSEAAAVRASALARVSGFPMLDALVTAVDNKDRYTRRHSEDVMTYSLQIAGKLGLDEKTQHTISVAALLHDLGKIGVPDAILRKPGTLTREEFEAVKQHPMMGAIIVQAVPGLEDTLDAVRYHHERWDGGGYPAGWRGEETPLIARLMAVADAFSAMTTDRPYRKSMAREKALSLLEAGAGTQWDPLCVESFLAMMRKAGEPAPVP